MDAKNRAKFINSIGAPTGETSDISQAVPTAEDGAEQTSTSQVLLPRDTKNVAQKVTDDEIICDDPHNAFAHGFPEWSLEPPMIVVRRRKK